MLSALDLPERICHSTRPLLVLPLLSWGIGFSQEKNPALGLLGSVSRVLRGAVDGGNAGTDGLKDISKREGSGVVSEQHFGFVVYSWVLFLLGVSCILLGGILIPRKT